MKRFIIAIILLLVTLTGSIGFHIITNKKINELILLMEKDRIFTVADTAADKSRTEAISEMWDKHEVYLGCVLTHHELENFETGLMCLENYMLQGNTEEYIKTLNECLNQLYHIRETEKVDIKNIF